MIKDPSNMDLLNFLRHTTAAFGLEKLTWAVLASLSIRMDWKRERERNIHNSPKEVKQRKEKTNSDCASFRKQFRQRELGDVVTHIGNHDVLLSLIKAKTKKISKIN